MNIKEFFRNDSDARLAALLQAHTEESTAAAKALATLFASSSSIREVKLKEIVAHEHRGDILTAQLRALLDEIFITKQLPKDHTSRLVSHLDDILDDMRDAARYVETYAIDEITPEALEFADAINAMVAKLAEIMGKLLTLSSDEVQVVYAELKKIESRADELRSCGVQALALRVKSASHPSERVMTLYLVVAWKDIYAKLERVTDHCLHAVNEVAALVRNY